MSALHAISHHPSDELLIAYASGASDEAIALLIATHLALCPRCRRAVGDIERAGGALLENLEPVAVSDTALDTVMTRLGERPASAAQPPSARAPDLSVPEPLRSYLPGGLTSGWIPIAPGIAHRPLFRRGQTRVRLIRAAPGRGVATHTHEGNEYTLVLSGGFTDKTGQYGPGDLQSTTPEITHEPIADVGETCMNLAVTDAPLRFDGLVPALIGKVFGF